MGKMSKAMKQMNKKMNLPKMQEMMMEFERQEAQMEDVQGMMDDVMDDALADPTAAESEEALIQQVLDEIGVDLQATIKAAPTTAVDQEDNEAVSSLEQRLLNLKRED